MSDNEDVYVQVVEPLFDEQTKRVKVHSLERVAANQDGSGEALKVQFELLEEIVDTMGNKHAPGYIFRPRPFVVMPGSPEQAQRAEMGRRDIDNILQATKVLPKASGHKWKSQIAPALGQVQGKELVLKFTVTPGKKRDPETNEFVMFQNVRFAPLGAAGNGAAAAGGVVKGDY